VIVIGVVVVVVLYSYYRLNEYLSSLLG